MLCFQDVSKVAWLAGGAPSHSAPFKVREQICVRKFVSVICAEPQKKNVCASRHRAVTCAGARRVPTGPLRATKAPTEEARGRGAPGCERTTAGVSLIHEVRARQDRNACAGTRAIYAGAVQSGTRSLRDGGPRAWERRAAAHALCAHIVRGAALAQCALAVVGVGAHGPVVEAL